MAYNRGKIKAATRMQNLYRSRKSWQRLNKIARRIYVKFYDTKSDRFYYFNPRTKKSYWKKPVLLGHFDAPLDESSEKPKIFAKDLDEDIAASMLQSSYRKRLARRRVLELVEAVYVRVKDETTGRYYFLNKNNGRSTWNAPLGVDTIHDLTKEDLEEIEKRNNGVEQRSDKDLFEEERNKEIVLRAATRLQAIWRGHHERDKIHRLVERIFEKVFDQSSGKYYYFNSMTNTSQWNKPRLMEYHQEGDAATKIQSIWRGYIARTKFSSVVENIYEKTIDIGSGREFYFNKLTNESRWDRPMFVRKS